MSAAKHEPDRTRTEIPGLAATWPTVAIPPTRESSHSAARIARETEIKKWRRQKKVALIEAQNPTWKDLAADWGKPAVMRSQIPPLLTPFARRNDKSVEGQ